MPNKSSVEVLINRVAQREVKVTELEDSMKEPEQSNKYKNKVTGSSGLSNVSIILCKDKLCG